MSTNNLTTARPSKKLDKKFVGPFIVKERIGSWAYRVELPKTMTRLHDVFDVSLPELYQSDGRSESVPPPDLQGEGEDEYEVEEILNSKRMRGELVYLVMWVGHSHEENTWELRDHLAHLDEYLADFHRKHPDKPGSPNEVVAKKGAGKRVRRVSMPKPAITRT